MTMPDGNTAALKRYEEEQARADRDFKIYGAEALDDVVERVMQGERVGGRLSGIDLWAFLESQADVHELLAKILTATSTDGQTIACADVGRWIESRLRDHLQDSEIVSERAAELAEDAKYFQNGEEWS